MGDRSEFYNTPLPSPITEFVCQVMSNMDGQQHYANGTAVIVSPFLALSARHVIEEHWRIHEGEREMFPGEGTGRFSLILAQLVGLELNLWTVTRLWTSGHTDIVAFRLTPYSPGAMAYTFRHLTLDLLPPAVGERISAFGYHSNEIEERDHEIVLLQGAATTHGTVLEVHDEFRDKARLRFPCFRTNARFDGGMSGGPVFNAAGHLCGMICSALPPTADDEDHASYVVSLWPAMAIMIELDREGHPKGVRYPMFELVRDNMLVARNADRVSVGEAEGTDSPPISLRGR